MFALSIHKSKKKKTIITSGSIKTTRFLLHNHFCGRNKALFQRRGVCGGIHFKISQKRFFKKSTSFCSSLMLAIGQIVQLESVTLSAKVI